MNEIPEIETTAAEQRKTDFMHGLTDLLLKAGVMQVVGREVNGDLVDVEPTATLADAIDKLLSYLSLRTCFTHIYPRTEEYIDRARLELSVQDDPFAEDAQVLVRAAEIAADDKASYIDPTTLFKRLWRPELEVVT